MTDQKFAKANDEFRKQSIDLFFNANGRSINIFNHFDKYRFSSLEGALVLTHGFDKLRRRSKDALLKKVAEYIEFDPGNDPYGLHDFGIVNTKTYEAWWKIDCFEDINCQNSPIDFEDVGYRLLTIYLPEEH